MIPALALMIAVYGSARLVSDVLWHVEESPRAHFLAAVISVGAAVALWGIWQSIESLGMDVADILR